MRLILLVLSLSNLFSSCQFSNNASLDKLNDSVPTVASEPSNIDTAHAESVEGNPQMLALTSNALQLVDSGSGSTREIAFGMRFDQLVEVVTKVLESAPTSIAVNTECGAGPLKMASWPNGLTLVFAERKHGDSSWLFAGWFVGKPTKVSSRKMTTMAGIGIGSTVQDLKSAYVATVTKTTLGQEFSVDSGFYGLLSGTGKNAVIEVMWSGTSCNFR